MKPQRKGLLKWILDTTRGHARFARSPLTIRLGDSGYREVLSSGWHCNYKITLTEHYRTNFFTQN